MSTWGGVIIDGAPAGSLQALAERGRLVVLEDTDSARILVRAEGSGIVDGSYAKSISEELNCTVVSYCVQTTSSVEQVEQWAGGRLARRLLYLDDQGWSQDGEAQEWEGAYFFSQDTAEDYWPRYEDDEISDEDVARYELAKASRNASSVLDLLHGGTASGLMQLFEYFGVDPEHPNARVHLSADWKPSRELTVALAVVVLAFVGLFVIGALMF